MTIWRMAMRDGKGGADMFDACRARGIAAITYAPLDEFDLTHQPRGEPRDLWSQLAPPQKGSLAHLAYDMKAGDTIYVKRDKWIIAIVWLAANGDDTIENTVALCPNCHRRMHVVNSASDRRALLMRACARSS